MSSIKEGVCRLLVSNEQEFVNWGINVTKKMTVADKKMTVAVKKMAVI